MDFSQWLAQLNFEPFWEILVTVSASLLCITVHEASHGLMANILGDPTAKRLGRLSLNPLKHIDIFGLVMMAVAKFGWAKPVPVDMRRFRNPKVGMALTAMAGPLSNVLLAGLAMLGYGLTVLLSYRADSALLEYISEFFLTTAVLSSGLAVFNLFPIPPLDGSKMLFVILPQQWYDRLMQYERYGMFVLIALVSAGVLDGPLYFLRNGLLGGLSALCVLVLDAIAPLLI